VSPAAKPPPPVSDTAHLELLLAAVTDYAIVTLDCEGRITSWNSGAENLYRCSAADSTGRAFSLFLPAEDQANDTLPRLLAEATQDGRAEHEGWHLRKDRSRFWGATLLHPMRDSAARLIGFAAITRDMSERRAARDALLESERHFRLLVEGVTDYAIYMLDPSGVVVNWNAGAQRMKGYSPEEVVGQHFSRFYTREDRTHGMPARMLETAAREGRCEAEGWRVRKDGSRFWASVVVDAIHDNSGKLLGFAKVTRDITERRAAQEALRDSERQFRTLVAGVTDYALYMLDPNGIVTNWNPGAQKIKGYTADEIVGQHFSRFYTEHERAAGMPAHVLKTAAEEGRYEAEAWRVRKDGSLFWANVVIDAIRDETGNIAGFVKITRDITERREAQLALQEAQTQRDYMQKMEALGQLTGGVAHDFNNLLMVVTGHLHSLKKLVGEDQRGRRAVQAMELAAHRGEALTRQLLTFSRRQTLNAEVTALAARLDAFRVLVAGSIGETVKLVTDLPSDIWSVKLDVSEFELALLNLVLNARDAMPRGGMVTISAENVQLTGKDNVQKLAGAFVALTIADTGTGIAEDILPKVFDPFFTTKQAEKGSGLGLSQVYGFAHQTGGTVAIESALGKGTAVTLYLPRASEAPARPAAEPEPAATAGGRVLLVEDNPEVAEVSCEMLEELGYAVKLARDAEAALSIVAGESFDLVVSDIVMAGALDGVGLARALRESHPALPVILVSGYSNAASLADAEFTVLRKPYKLADLSRAAAKTIAEARQPPPHNLINLRDVRRPPKPERA